MTTNFSGIQVSYYKHNTSNVEQDKTFTIKNGKTFFFIEKSPLILLELYRLLPELSFNKELIEAKEEDVNEQGEPIIKTSIKFRTPLPDFEKIQIFDKDKGSQYINLAYDNSSTCYQVTVPAFSTEQDWAFAIEFIKALAKRVNSKAITTPSGKTFSLNEFTYDYKKDIQQAIAAIINRTESTKLIKGIGIDFCFDEEMTTRLKNAEDQIKCYSDMLTDFYNIDASYATGFLLDDVEESFVDEDGEELSLKEIIDPSNEMRDPVYIYSFIQGEDKVGVILPKKTFDATEERLTPDDINTWAIELGIATLTTTETIDHQTRTKRITQHYRTEIIGVVEYDKFINSLPKDRYYSIDGNHYLIDHCTKEEMESLVQEKNTQ